MSDQSISTQHPAPSIKTGAALVRAAKARGKTHFFDKDTMSFFNSRVSKKVFCTQHPYIFVFVTSERCDWNDRYETVIQSSVESDGIERACALVEVLIGDARTYTIRAYNDQTGNVDTLGEFGEFLTEDYALAIAKEIAPSISTLEDLDRANSLVKDFAPSISQ